MDSNILDLYLLVPSILLLVNTFNTFCRRQMQSNESTLPLKRIGSDERFVSESNIRDNMTLFLFFLVSRRITRLHHKTMRDQRLYSLFRGRGKKAAIKRYHDSS